ncbi:Transcriptional activator [Gnomoniopsis smithogilvyi]|uniref:Transcriptional activator n=1 Tax=Gnomoniopsis smithogilvyi TaxID=1191159 RepID=A0A9W9CTE5_9PEZI|nr:Transcriptional activator [Gnomoniopsis smithogilvyi]
MPRVPSHSSGSPTVAPDPLLRPVASTNVKESYLRELEAKVKFYEESHPDLKLAFASLGRPNPSPVPGEDDMFGDDMVMPEAFTQVGVGSPGNTSTGFKGPAHSDHFLKSFGKVSLLEVDDESLDQHADFYDREALPSRRLSTRGTMRLPPIDIARQLFAAQYTYIGTIFSFTDHAAFERLLQEAYRGPPDLSDQNACLAQSKLLVILAFGKLYSVNQWIDYSGPPGFEYFTHALELLPDIHDEGSTLFVETLALVGYFMQNLNRRDAAWLYVGMALRMAITLGLHQETSSPDLDNAAKEHRRRVWWSVYSLDRIQSVKSGNPITIYDEDIGVAFPSKLPGEPEYCAAVVLKHYTKLSQICGEITLSIYRRTPKSGPNLMAAVKKIITSLSQWHRELPMELRFDPARLSISRESVSTLLHYSQCINMTARPLLFHVVQKRLKSGLVDKERNWKEGLNQTTVKVIEMCVAAAQDTINMMTIASQKNLVATYGYMDSEHAFSAAIVLVMVCVTFPTNQQTTNSMVAALELLRGMSKRGNSHMSARYELLNRLRTTFIPSAVSLSPTDTDQIPSERNVPTPVARGSTVSHEDQPRLLSPPAGFDVQPAAVRKRTTSVPGLAASQQPAVSDVRMNTPSGVQIPSEFSMQAMPDFTFLTNPSLDADMFYDVDMSGASSNNQAFWEEAFANTAGDPGSSLMESLEWTQTVMDQFGNGANAMGM